ncbi:MAG TPA: RnfABCDGE type electron transport complex subunit D [Pseudolysinimonas sp.]|nr:RnfABCDGE type electron transport complex subunit D [Pseudolysinimonas sp.]
MTLRQAQGGVAWLDTLLGRATMYRLIAYCLGALQVFAIVFSFLGVVPVATPLAMIVSFAVLLVVALGANFALAAIFRVTSHPTSTVITAQLLFFLMFPTLDPLGLVGLAVAGVTAVASKYLIAIRGRHIFNPAAFGGFVASLIGVAAGQFWKPIWWVGTAWLLPLVIVAGFLILFRTRRLPMGGVFIAVATITGIGFYLLIGSDLPSAITFALVSAPTFFLAGFMLSEPLTLPPRRWQQLGYAAVVGVLMWTTSSVAILANAPEFALLVANLLAFLVGQRRGIRLEFAARRQLSPTAWELDFTARTPIAFRPGQFMELTLPHGKTDSRGWRRVFSIASAPGDVVRFGIRLPERASSFKRALLALEPGAKVSATSVGGDFVLPSDPTRPLLLVAGGIGITPFIGHLEQAAAESGERDIAVVYAISSLDDLAYAAQLERSGCAVTLASPERPHNLPAGWSWIGPDRISGESLLAAVPDALKREAFLSGPPSMVASLRKALRKAGVRRIHTDVFVGY